MKSSDKISIVLPCYKAERCIANMIRDIQAQTYTNWELIVVSNGGGQELQLKIIREFEEHDRRIHCYSIDEAGPGPARNFGIEKATGTWIAFVDADDRVLSGWLNSYVPALCKYPDIIVAGFRQKLWYNNEEILQQLPQSFHKYDTVLTDKHEYIPLLLSHEILLAPPWNKIFAKAFIQKNNLRFQKYTLYEDSIFNLDAIIKCSTFSFVKNSGYIYYVSFYNGLASRCCQRLNEAGEKRINLWCSAMKEAAIAQSEIEYQRVKMSEALALQLLLNTFRTNTQHTFKSRVKLVSGSFKRVDACKIVAIYASCKPSVLERLFLEFHKRNMTWFCVVVFSLMHWARRNMKPIAGIIVPRVQ